MLKSSRSNADSGVSQTNRARTFSGCWTCRAKHVKCDETQPTCNRCRRLKLNCEGYGVKISWTSVRSPSNFKSKSQKRKTSHIVNNSIVTFCKRDSTTHQRSDVPQPEPSRGNDSLRDKHDAPEGGTSQNITGVSARPNEYSPLQDDAFTDDLCDQLYRSYGTLGQGFTRDGSYAPSAVPSDSQAESADAQVDDLDTEEINTPLQFNGYDASYPNTQWSPQPPSYSRHSKAASNWELRKTNMADVNATIGIRHLDVMPDIGLQCQLVEHWSTCACDALSPVPGVHNILRTVFMPIALEGARAGSTTSTGATALFHLICSASAFHLSTTKGTPFPGHSLEKIALEHHNLGIVHLGQNIHQAHNEGQCISVLASLLMCILNEAVTVPTPFWHVHLRGAIDWVKNSNPQLWHQSESGSATYQFFMAMAILAQSQFLLGDPNDALWDLCPGMELQPGQYVLETSYGLPQSILQYIHEMNQLRIECESFEGQSPHHDKAISEKLDVLELELFLSVPIKPDMKIGKEYESLVYHYGYVYYFGALIYLKRIVRDRPLDEVQVLVEQSLSHIESLESCTSRPFCPSLWPIAIIAFDTGDPELQNRMLESLRTFASRSGLGVATQLAVLVQQLWTLRKEEGDPNLRWHKSVLPSMNSSFILF